MVSWHLQGPISLPEWWAEFWAASLVFVCGVCDLKLSSIHNFNSEILYFLPHLETDVSKDSILKSWGIASEWITESTHTCEKYVVCAGTGGNHSATVGTTKPTSLKSGKYFNRSWNFTTKIIQSHEFTVHSVFFQSLFKRMHESVHWETLNDKI